MSTTDQQIADLEARIKPLMSLLEGLRAVKRKEESVEFVRVNKITKEDVERPDWEGRPYLWNIYDFANWMRDNNCQRRFCTWNGRIYFTSDILAGLMPDTPGLIEDVL